MESFKNALKYCPNYEEPYYRLAATYYKLKEVKLAKKQIKLLIKKFPAGNFTRKSRRILTMLNKRGK